MSKKSPEETLTELRGMLMDAIVEGLQPGEEVYALKKLIEWRDNALKQQVRIIVAQVRPLEKEVEALRKSSAHFNAMVERVRIETHNFYTSDDGRDAWFKQKINSIVNPEAETEEVEE